MARVALSAAALSHVGTDLNAGLTVATVDGHSYPNQPDLKLMVKNTSGASINVTFQTSYTKDGLALPDLVEALAAGAMKEWALHGDEIYSQAGGEVWVDYSTPASASVKLIRG